MRFEWRPKIHLNSWQALLNYLYMCSLSNGSFLHISWKLSCSWHCHVIARWSCVQIQSEAFLCGASFSLWVFFGYSSFNPCHISVSCSGCTLPLTPRQSWQTSVPTTFNWMSVTKSIDVSVIRIVYLKSITRNLKKIQIYNKYNNYNSHITVSKCRIHAYKMSIYIEKKSDMHTRWPRFKKKKDCTGFREKKEEGGVFRVWDTVK